MLRVQRYELHGFAGFSVQELCQHLAPLRADDNAVAFANLGGFVDKKHVPIAVKRHHGFAGNFHGHDVFTARARKGYFIPSLARRITRIVEVAAIACLRLADEWNDHITGRPDRLGSGGEKRDEFVKRCTRCLKNFRQGLC